MLKLAYFIELSWLFVDTVSGYFQNHSMFLPGNQTVSAVVRLLVILFFLFIILRHLSLKQIPALLLLMLCNVFTLVHTIGNAGGILELTAEIQFMLKLMMPVVLYYVIQIQINTGHLDHVRLWRIITFNSAVLLFNLFIGVFGIGFGNYGEMAGGELLGSKGFFYAGNEVSATLVAIFALTYYVNRRYFQSKPLIFVFVVCLFFLASLLSLSKTSLLGFIIVLLFILKNELSVKKLSKLVATLSFILAISLPYWMPLLQVSIDRWEYFWEISPDFFTFITSGRSDRIIFYVNWINNTDSWMPLIFGMGVGFGDLIVSFENDLLDLTYKCGILGLLFYAMWVSWGIRGLFASMINNVIFNAFTLYMMVTFLVLSVIAGHVMYSATLAPFIALLALTSNRNFPDNGIALQAYKR